jgi:hypothetical protein
LEKQKNPLDGKRVSWEILFPEPALSGGQGLDSVGQAARARINNRRVCVRAGGHNDQGLDRMGLSAGEKGTSAGVASREFGFFIISLYYGSDCLEYG